MILRDTAIAAVTRQYRGVPIRGYCAHDMGVPEGIVCDMFLGLYCISRCEYKPIICKYLTKPIFLALFFLSLSLSLSLSLILSLAASGLGD